MTSLMILFYLSTVAPKIAIIVFAVIFCFTFVILVSDNTPEIWSKCKGYVISLLVALIICMAAPTEKLVYVYAAAIGADEITKLPEFQKTRALLNNTIDKLIKESNGNL